MLLIVCNWIEIVYIENMSKTYKTGKYDNNK